MASRSPCPTACRIRVRSPTEDIWSLPELHPPILGGLVARLSRKKGEEGKRSVKVAYSRGWRRMMSRRPPTSNRRLADGGAAAGGGARVRTHGARKIEPKTRLLRFPPPLAPATRRTHGSSAAPMDVHSERTMLEFSGDLTQEERGIQLFRAAREAIWHAPRSGRVLLDLRGVNRADTKLVAHLIRLLCLAHRHGVSLELRPSTCALELLTLCDLETLLEMK